MDPSMISLKKILMPIVMDNIRSMIAKCLTHGVWLTFAGIDALNFHFAGKEVRNGLINLALVPNLEASEHDFDAALKVAISELREVLNEGIRVVANIDSAVNLKKILDKHFNATTFEVLPGGNVLQYAGKVFVVVDIHDDLEVTLFDRFGMKYLPLKTVCETCDASLERPLRRNNLTLASWTCDSLIRECFPAVAMRKVKSKAIVRKMCEAKPEMCETLLAELEEYDDDDSLRRVLTLDELISRASKAGFIPPDHALRKVLTNNYNATLVSETATELLD